MVDLEQRMAYASEEARASFKYFWRELSWEYRRIIPGLDLALVKVPFATDQADPAVPPYEFCWIQQLAFDGEFIAGVVTDAPRWVSDIAAGDSVTVALTDISDWMYVMEDKAYGAFTLNVLRSDMAADERARYDETWGCDFGDPCEVMISPFHSPEHPMSENMARDIRQYLEAQPELVHQKDRAGWTLLQREALAGNLAPVKLLVEFGADLNYRNTNGHSALDLAKKMRWDRISHYLEQQSILAD